MTKKFYVTVSVAVQAVSNDDALDVANLGMSKLVSEDLIDDWRLVEVEPEED